MITSIFRFLEHVPDQDVEIKRRGVKIINIIKLIL